MINSHSFARDFFRKNIHIHGYKFETKFSIGGRSRGRPETMLRVTCYTPHRQTRMLRSYTLRPSEDVTLRPYPSFSRLQNETRNIINGGLRSMKCPAVLCKHENHYWVSKGWSSIQIYKADLMGDSISVANREANEILRFVTRDTRNVKHNVEKLRNKSRTCEQKLCKRQGRLKASSKQKLLTKRLCKDNER